MMKQKQEAVLKVEREKKKNWQKWVSFYYFFILFFKTRYCKSTFTKIQT